MNELEKLLNNDLLKMNSKSLRKLAESGKLYCPTCKCKLKSNYFQEKETSILIISCENCKIAFIIRDEAGK